MLTTTKVGNSSWSKSQDIVLCLLFCHVLCKILGGLCSVLCAEVVVLSCIFVHIWTVCCVYAEYLSTVLLCPSVTRPEHTSDGRSLGCLRLVWCAQGLLWVNQLNWRITKTFPKYLESRRRKLILIHSVSLSSCLKWPGGGAMWDNRAYSARYLAIIPIHLSLTVLY